MQNVTPSLPGIGNPSLSLTTPSLSDDRFVEETPWFGNDGVTFNDLIDIVNPLHHLPFVGPVYREFTGDQIDPAPRIFGGTLYGGPLGAAVAFTNVAIKEKSGKDIGEHVIAGLGLDAASRNRAVASETPGFERPSSTPPAAPLDDVFASLTTPSITQNAVQAQMIPHQQPSQPSTTPKAPANKSGTDWLANALDHMDETSAMADAQGNLASAPQPKSHYQAASQSYKTGNQLASQMVEALDGRTSPQNPAVGQAFSATY